MTRTHVFETKSSKIGLTNLSSVMTSYKTKAIRIKSSR